MKKEVKEKSGDPGWVEFCKRMNINPNLVMLKVTLFVMYGASASLVPFLTIHMQSIGLTVEEIAVVYLALPLTTFLAPPVTGFLVDKFGHYKPVLIISLVLNVVFHHALMLIPQMETPGEIPSAYVMRHPTSGKIEVWWSPCPSRECPEELELNMVLDDCLDYCSVKNPESTPPPSWFKGIEKSIAYRPPTLLGHSECSCPKSKYSETGDALAERGSSSNNEHRIQFLFGKPQGHRNATKAKAPIKKNKNGKNGTSTISPNGTNGTNATHLTDMNGAHNGNMNETDPSHSVQNVTKPEEDHSTYFLLGMHPDLMTASEQLGMELPEPEDSSEVTDFRQHFSEELLLQAGVNYTALEEADLRCGGRVIATNLTINRLKEMAADCMLQKCDFRAGGPEVCPPDYKESDDRVFWLYFALRFIGNTMHLASVTIMDPIALQMIQQHGGEFGRERLFSTIGMAIFSPLTGLLIDQRSRWLGYTDYSSAFWSYDALLCISVVTVMLMPLGVKVPADNIMQDMIRLIRFPHVITFIFFLFALGNCWGFIESFLFLYLKELGAPNYLLGITVSVGTISSIPFLYGAEKITKRFGHVKIIVIAFFSHAVRLMGYSFIEDPWWVFPFEAIEALAVHLMWVAAATYCAILAPKNLLATLIGVLGMAHFSLGRGSGSFVGGLLIGKVGTRKSFRIMGLLSITCGVIYAVLHCLWLHKFDEKHKKVDKKDPNEVEKLNGDVQTEEEEEKARVSLMIKFNHRGSLSSLDRDKMYSSLSRRSSANIELNSKTLPPIIKISSKPESINTLIETYNLQRKSPLQISRKISKVHEENEVLAAEMNSQQSLNLPPSISTTPIPQILTDESRARSDSIQEE